MVVDTISKNKTIFVTYFIKLASRRIPEVRLITKIKLINIVSN